MRCLLDTLPFVTRDKKGEEFWYMRLVILRGGVIIGHFVRGSVDMRDVVKILCIFSFLSFLDTLFLYFRSCDHFYLHTLYLSSLYMDVCFSFTYSLHVLFLFSLYAHASYYLYAIYYFYFTQRCLDEFFFKVFQKYRLSKSTCHKLSSCKIFPEFVLE